MVIKQLSQRCSVHFSTICIGKGWFNFLYDMETTSLVRFLLSFLPFVVHSWNNPFFTLSHYFAYFAFHVCGWSMGFCLYLNPVALRWKLMSCFPNVFSKFTPPYFISNLEPIFSASRCQEPFRSSSTLTISKKMKSSPESWARTLWTVENLSLTEEIFTRFETKMFSCSRKLAWYSVVLLTVVKLSIINIW